MPGFIYADADSAPAANARDDRFDGDWEQRAAEVNEGELRVLDQDDGRREHHHHTRVSISEQSLESGWVELHQCHRQLDPVAALQIVYREGRVRDLRIESSNNIGEVSVEGHKIELVAVQQDSSICVSLLSEALHREAGRYVLRNGPFMRRFLDGYYPMHVSMEVIYPGALLRYENTRPDEIAAYVRKRRGRLELDLRFEGRLTTEISFTARVSDKTSNQ